MWKNLRGGWTIRGDGAMNRYQVGLASAIAGWTLMMPATAAAADISVPLDTVVANGVAAGERFELALVSTSDLAGETCLVRAVHGGNAAAHPGNDLIVTSGDETTLTDVERESGATTEADDPITLANTITVELLMGPDQHYGGDIDLEFECGQQVAAFRSAAQPAQSSGGGILPLTGSQIAVTLMIAIGLVGTAAGLTGVARRRPAR